MEATIRNNNRKGLVYVIVIDYIIAITERKNKNNEFNMIACAVN